MPKDKKKTEFKGKFAEIQIRRDKTLQLLVRGYNNCEIAKALGTSEKTIRRDRKWIEKEWTKKLKENPVEKTLTKAYMLMDSTVRQTWNRYHVEGATEDNKVRCLGLLMNAAMNYSRILNNLGLIPKEPLINIDNRTQQIDHISLVQFIKSIKEKEKKIENEG